MYLIATVGVLLLALPALAHYPEDTTFKVFQFPDDHVPQMDGDAADWTKVPPEYFYDYTQYAELHRERGAPDTTEERYSAVGWQGAVEHLSSGTVIYECYLTPFDDLHPEGPHLSRRHSLQEGAIIGLGWSFLDADTKEDTFDAFWALTQHPKMYCSGEFIGDFELMPIEEGLFGGSE